MPSPSQRKEMLKLIKQVPGCDFYKIVNIVDWFKRRLERAKKVAPDDRFPSISPAALEHLKVLVKSQRNPSADVVATWAVLLRVKSDDIVAWLRSQGLPEEEVNLPTPASTITPSSSASPKPAPQAYPAHYRTIKQDPSVSPILSHITPAPAYYQPRVARPTSELSISTTTSQATSAFPSPLSPVEDKKTWHPRVISLETAIAQGVKDAAAKPRTPPTVLPKSAAEFNAMFAAHEDTLTQLYQAFKAS
ncbi:hypothetical protein M413DRAFT_350477 [Hebeloma cylindrosporum]|uniref:Uncharacterized protein n=1 Tax=Hebeloma cylindrosporum TaxID=76867 RepID=A0A0C3BTB4_HEBCY|nr:hypothetical protein M413DRAFT_350477 [Hebeloma cylindrosporum h7]